MHLDGDLLDIVGDIIGNPSTEDKDDAVKHRNSSLSESQDAKLHQLLRGQLLLTKTRPCCFNAFEIYLQDSENVLRSLFWSNYLTASVRFWPSAVHVIKAFLQSQTSESTCS